jgi:hypothetical protein
MQRCLLPPQQTAHSPNSALPHLAELRGRRRGTPLRLCLAPLQVGQLMLVLGCLLLEERNLKVGIAAHCLGCLSQVNDCRWWHGSGKGGRPAAVG